MDEQAEPFERRLEAEDFRRAWRRFFGVRILHGERLTLIDLEQRPTFVFVEPVDRRDRVWAALTSLTVWTAALSCAALLNRHRLVSTRA